MSNLALLCWLNAASKNKGGTPSHLKVLKNRNGGLEGPAVGGLPLMEGLAVGGLLLLKGPAAAGLLLLEDSAVARL